VKTKLKVERDGSTLDVQGRGTWVCLTLARDDTGRAKDILLSPHDADNLAAWLTDHNAAQAG